MNTLVTVKRALLSVSDKTGLIALAQKLRYYNVELIATGGTLQALASAGLPALDVAQVTGYAPMLDGRVKSLHPAIHGALLARRDDAAHMAQLHRHDIAPIDLVVISLYPFERKVTGGAPFEECIETIDIGGPAMIRSAAKNHHGVVVVTDPCQYETLCAALDAHHGATPLALRRSFAHAAFLRTASYDAAVSAWLGSQVENPECARFVLAGEDGVALRYGENPHQTGMFYKTLPVGVPPRAGVATATQIQGKPLSYNNINDTNAAFELVAEFNPAERPAVAIIKHANPCGVAVGESLSAAYGRALACDPVSAYGGIIALNQTLDLPTAQKIAEMFTEVVIAPDATPEARALLARKKALRLLLTGGLPDVARTQLSVRSVSGGFLLQPSDGACVDAMALTAVTKRAPTADELKDLKIAFKIAKHVKSNAIVFVKNGASVGIGAGQMSRVDAARIAIWKALEAGEALAQNPAGSLLTGSVVASDAFFPFADGIMAALEAGARAIIQPGGSIRDAEVIAAADAHDAAMVFTGVRHFRH